ncbi:MAG: DUF4810 domain-containing protein [Bacteroidota bacterium]|jgi:Uncharacterized protein conserved in bacteria|nr:DUF4810 domain-containing protein [Bacteroidota bacterium]
MRNVFYCLLTMLLLASCQNQKSLYSWSKYETTSYDFLKNKDEKSTQKLIESYQAIIEKQEGSRKVVPPGIYADYGFILIQSGKAEQGKAMLQKEVAIYPESKVFVERILKMLDK